MLIKRKSNITGEWHEREIDCTLEEFMKWQKTGAVIQVAFPNLSAEDREFILTGITPEEWDRFLPEEPEEWEQ
jgi:hypothetical protein